MPEGFTLVLVIILGLAVVFDYIIGFHDTANAIATSVSTRALRPEQAIALSATANFVGALTGTAVATTIGKGLVDEQALNAADPSLTYLAAAIIGGLPWNLLTWRLGIPSLRSHPLIGGPPWSSIAAAGLSVNQVDVAVGQV